MSSAKALLVALCVLSLTLPLRAENRTDDRPKYPADYEKPPSEVGGKDYAKWKGELSHPDPGVRAQAIIAMLAFRKQGEDAVPKLATMAQRDPDASPRVKAVIALKMMGIRATDITRVVEALGYCVAHDDQTVIRYEAATALQRFGSETRRVIPQLLMAMNNRNTYDVRKACIIALRAAGVDAKKGPDPRVTDALIARLNPFAEPSDEVRLQAIMALGGMGRPQDPKKYGDLLRGLRAQNVYNSPHKIIKLWAHVAIMALEEKVDEKYLERTVADYLKSEERDIRMHGLMAMGALGTKANAYAKDVVRLLRDKEPEVVGAACNALGGIGDKSDRVLKGLIAVTEREGTREHTVPLVKAACAALAQLHVANADVMKALNKVLERKDFTPEDKDEIRKAIEDIKKKPDDDDTTKPKGKTPDKLEKRQIQTKK